MAGLAKVLGSGAMTNSIRDIENSQVILVAGSNTTETHPVIAAAIKRAVQFRGARLIVADPRRIKLTEYAHIWLRPKPGTDIAWINSLLNVILDQGIQDQDYIDRNTRDWDRLREHVRSYTPEYARKISGIPEEDLIRAAQLYGQARPASIWYTMGITQHTCGTDNVLALANLALACGNVGVPGGGINPLRGQNNVQGACDMGALPEVYSGYQKVSDPGHWYKMASSWGVHHLPAIPGLRMTEMFPAAREGRIKGMYIIGENPVLSDPDNFNTHNSLDQLDFLVVQDIFFTETAAKADVILPACSYAEKDGTFTNTERRVQRVRPAISPAGNSRPDWEILADLASRFGYPMSYDSPREIMQEIARLTPSYAGIEYSRLEKEGIQWPCPEPGHPGTEVLHSGGFPEDPARFQCVSHSPPAESVDQEHPLWLTTGRMLYHYHGGSMTRKVRGLNLLGREPFVEVSGRDAHNLGLKDWTRVVITSRRGRIQARARIVPGTEPGTVFIPIHFAEAAANVLTSPATDPVSGIPEYKACAVRLEKGVNDD